MAAGRAILRLPLSAAMVSRLGKPDDRADDPLELDRSILGDRAQALYEALVAIARMEPWNGPLVRPIRSASGRSMQTRKLAASSCPLTARNATSNPCSGVPLLPKLAIAISHPN